MNYFNNKTVIVTGANRGIGKAIVETLLQQDVRKIYACARNTASLAFIEDERVKTVALDITQQNQIDALAQQASDADVLINNAGINTSGKLLETSMDDTLQDFNVNFIGTVSMIKALSPVIASNGGGNIVNVISICGLAAMPSLAGYSISKAALFSASQALRTELKAKNIVLNAIYPGPVDTDMNEGLEIDMASPADLAKSMLAGVAEGQEDIFPDAMSQDVYRMWSEHPKILEQNFAQY